MNLFKSIFSKKSIKEENEPANTQLQKGDIFISFTNRVNFKVIRPLSDRVKDKLNSSRLSIVLSAVYSHYQTHDLIYKGQNDQNWQNQVVYFWKADEPFPKKSLPPVFDTYIKKRFIFISNKSNVSLNHGKVIPWLGMPGLGEKYFCEMSNEKVTVPDLKTLGIVEYIEPVQLTDENADLLTDPGQYFYVMDERMVQFKNNSLYVQDKLVSKDIAYSIGGIQILKKTE